VNDIIEIIEDLKEIREAVNLNDSVHIAIDQKIEKYQKILNEFENANGELPINKEDLEEDKDRIGDESPDLTWAGTSGYSV
tara:strand:+ start:410 stop:652 length:243 start_codon:yes stop_codon:yes gene_type:complete